MFYNIWGSRKFMVVFGLLSTIFDYVTFGTLLLVLHSITDQFRTAWFIDQFNSEQHGYLCIYGRPCYRKRIINGFIGSIDTVNPLQYAPVICQTFLDQ
jgi:hypothetical protein